MVYLFNSLQPKFLKRNIDQVRTSQETYYVSTTNIDHYILFRETVGICCANSVEHINALCEKSAHYIYLKQAVNIQTTGL
jgi:hypothetical protein